MRYLIIIPFFLKIDLLVANVKLWTVLNIINGNMRPFCFPAEKNCGEVVSVICWFAD